MTALRQPEAVTWEEYDALDEASPVKLEFLAGEIVAMAGTSPTHALITANIIGSVHGRLRGKPCYITSPDQRVKAQARDDAFYPDAQVICPPARFDPHSARTLLNPTVVFEVLSPSTAERDLTFKSDAYFQIESVAAYVLIAQDRVRVEVRTRGDGAWNVRVWNQLSGIIELPSIGISLPLGEIYDRLDLPSGLQLVLGSEGD